MKRLFILIIVLASFIGAQAQTQTVKTVSDTVNGSETVYLQIPLSGKYQSVAMDVQLDSIGGTPDGTITIEGAIDDNWFTLTPSSMNNAETFTTGTVSNDSLTIVKDKTWYHEFLFPSPTKYRYKIEGTASDSTLVTVKYYLK